MSRRQFARKELLQNIFAGKDQWLYAVLSCFINPSFRLLCDFSSMATLSICSCTIAIASLWSTVAACRVRADRWGLVQPSVKTFFLPARINKTYRTQQAVSPFWTSHVNSSVHFERNVQWSCYVSPVELSGICSVSLAAFVFLFVHDCMSASNTVFCLSTISDSCTSHVLPTPRKNVCVCVWRQRIFLPVNIIVVKADSGSGTCLYRKLPWVRVVLYTFILDRAGLR